MLGSRPSRRPRPQRRIHWSRAAAAVVTIVFCGGFWLSLASCAVNRLAPLPPKAFRSDATATVRFVSDVHAVCAAAAGDTTNRLTYTGCERDGVIVLPNPCHWPNRSDYADLTCHELGHVRGWPGGHPND